MVDLKQGYISPALLKDLEKYTARLGRTASDHFIARYVRAQPQDDRPSGTKGSEPKVRKEAGPGPSPARLKELSLKLDLPPRRA